MKSIVERVFGQGVLSTVNVELNLFVDKSFHIRTAVLSTADGFSIASSVKDDYSGEKLSAMSGSIYALAESVTHEVNEDSCDTMILESASSRIVLCAIPDSHPAVILTVMSSEKVLLGDLLYSAKACAGKIKNLLIKTN